MPDILPNTQNQNVSPRPPQPPRDGSLGIPSSVFTSPPGREKPAETEPVIHTIPAEYYGIAPKTAVKKIVSPSTTVAPLPQPKPKPLAPATDVKKKKGLPFAVPLVIGGAFFFVIAIGGYLFLVSLRSPPPRVPATNTVTTNIVTPTPTPVIPVTVCGNSICETGETATSCVSDCTPPPPVPIRTGIDSDSDGITDIEETEIYHSDPKNADTDSDTFIDGNEVLHLYDPTRPSPALLDGSTFVSVTTLSGYRFLSPKSWEVTPETTSSTLSVTTTLTSATGALVRVTVAPSATPDEDIATHAVAQFPGISFGPYHVKGAITGLRSADGQTIILSVPGHFVTFGYDLVTGRTIEYLRTFEAIVQSFLVSQTK